MLEIVVQRVLPKVICHKHGHFCFGTSLQFLFSRFRSLYRVLSNCKDSTFVIALVKEMLKITTGLEP